MSQTLIDFDADGTDDDLVEYAYGPDGLRTLYSATTDEGGNGFDDDIHNQTKYLYVLPHPQLTRIMWFR
jgi:hypothetical protein